MPNEKQERKRRRILSSPSSHGSHRNTLNSTAHDSELNMASSSGEEDMDETFIENSQQSSSQLSINEKLDHIILKLDSLESKFDSLKSTVDEHGKKLTKLERQVDVNSGKIFSVEKKMDDLPSGVDYQNLADKIEDQANRLRRNNIVLHNIPEETEGKGTYDCSDFVRGFIMNHMDLGGDEDSWEIERAHRSPTGPPRENRVRPIHVKFLRYQDRVKVLKAAPSKLKDNPFTPPNSLRSSNVYISDDVTENVRRQRKKLVTLKKKIQEKWPGKKVFIPPVVPAMLLRETEDGKLIRMYPGDQLATE